MICLLRIVVPSTEKNDRFSREFQFFLLKNHGITKEIIQFELLIPNILIQEMK